MSRLEDTIWCRGCGIEITWIPFIIDDQDFCCENCAYGFSCECGAMMDWEDEYRDAASFQTQHHDFNHSQYSFT